MLRDDSRLLSPFRISAAMRPYVLRVRLHGWHFDFGSNPEAAAAFTTRIGEMRRILVARHISVFAADQAILKTMKAAIDFQLAELRYRSVKTMESQSQDTLDTLIQGLRKLSDAIAQLPPTPKGELNKRVSATLRQATFDSEVFIEIVETITAALPEVAPRRLADNIFSIIHPEPREGRRSPVIDQWETMPATTRVKVEGLMQQAKPSTSLVQWLNRLVDLLGRECPARKRGAPRSIAQAFVSRTAAIWQTLGLNAGLAYDFFLHPRTGSDIGRGGRVESGFQRYCRTALTAVGDPTEVSARQVANYKKMQRKNL